MKARSPLLGYNHNIRYSGRLYHVQTEDSGVNNPHIFTHLFFEGTILASTRADYDPESEDGAVQKVMQTQHKAMLRDLRDGLFDIKIQRFFGDKPAGVEVEMEADLPGESEGTPPPREATTQPSVPAVAPREAPPRPSVTAVPVPIPADIDIPIRPLSSPLVDPVPAAPVKPATPPRPLAPPSRPMIPTRGIPAAPVRRGGYLGGLDARFADDAEATLVAPPLDLPVPDDERTEVRGPDLTAARPEAARVPPAAGLAGADTIPVPRLDPTADESRPTLVMPRAAAAPLRPPTVPTAPPPLPLPPRARPSTTHAAPQQPFHGHDPRHEARPAGGAAPETRPSSPMPRNIFDLPKPVIAAQIDDAFRDLHYTPSRVPAVPPTPRKNNSAVLTRPSIVAPGRHPSSTHAPITSAPAARPNPAAPPEPGADNIFGDDPYSDKSLDEVILAYLSEDPPGK